MNENEREREREKNMVEGEWAQNKNCEPRGKIVSNGFMYLYTCHEQ